MATPEHASPFGGATPSHMSAHPSLASASHHAHLATASALHAHNEQLKGELAKAVHIAQELQQQNQVLQSAWAKLKSESEELKDSYALVRSQAESALAAKQSAESECEKLYGVWQEKLEQKQAEFEVIQQSMVPTRELDLIRLQILQEASAGHAAHTEELKGEVAKYRQLYHDTHHSLVLLTNDANLKTQSYEKDVADLRARSERSVAELSAKNRKLQDLVQDTTLPDRAKALERANNEMTIRNKALAAEVTEVTKKLADSIVAAEQAKVAQSSSEASQRALEGRSAKEAELAERTITELTKELAVATAQAQSLREESLHLTKLSDHASSQHEVEVQELKFSVSTLEQRLKEAERKEAETAVKTRETIEAANERNINLERRLADANQESEYATREHAASVKALKEEHACTVREMEHQALLLQEAKARLQQNMLEQELAKNEEIAQLQQRLLTIQSEVAVLHAERDGFDARAAEMKADADGVRSELDAKVREHHELNLEYEQLQSKYRGLAEKEHAIEGAFDKLTLEADSMRAELAAAGASIEEERKKYLQDVHALKNASRHDKQTLLARLEEVATAAQSSEERRAKEITDLKHEKSKYKKISLSLKQKMGEVLR